MVDRDHIYCQIWVSIPSASDTHLICPSQHKGGRDHVTLWAARPQVGVYACLGNCALQVGCTASLIVNQMTALQRERVWAWFIKLIAKSHCWNVTIGWVWLCPWQCMQQWDWWTVLDRDYTCNYYTFQATTISNIYTYSHPVRDHTELNRVRDDTKLFRVRDHTEFLSGNKLLDYSISLSPTERLLTLQ